MLGRGLWVVGVCMGVWVGGVGRGGGLWMCFFIYLFIYMCGGRWAGGYRCVCVAACKYVLVLYCESNIP